MATITNIIQTIFSSQGASSTTRDVDHLGRAQTRLSQSSASAGRSFAAQSQGLGGLVAAYAGAAATTFALQQAYDKLSKSARSIQTLEGLSTLAARSAIDGNKLLKSVQELTKNQMTLAETAQQINLSLSAGFNTKQIEGLSTVALKASRALGRDLTDAMTRVTRGSAKMETELLDELGIYTKIESATRAYAIAIGKPVAKLSEYERRQAFVNAVIAEGTKKFSAINTVIPTTAEKIEAFGTRMIDLATKFGMFVAEGLSPVFDFLTNNLSAALSAFGLLAGLVASKGISTLKDELHKTSKAMADFGANTELSITKFGSGKALRDASFQIADFNEENMKLTVTQKEQYAAIRNTLKTRALTRSEMKAGNELLTTHVNALKAERDQVKAGYTAKVENLRVLAKEKQALKSNVKDLEAQLTAKRQQATAATSSVDQAFANAEAASINRRLLAANASLTTKTMVYDTIRAAAADEATRISGTVSTLTSSIEEVNAAQEDVNKSLGSKFSKAGSIFNKTVGVITTGLHGILDTVAGVAGTAAGLFQLVTTLNLVASTIANIAGMGPQYEAFIQKMLSAVQNFVQGARTNDLKKIGQGLAAGSLTELEKVDGKLANIDSFKFKDKFIIFDVDIEKTKEQITTEVADIIAKLSDPTPGKTLGESLISPAAGWGAAIGAVVIGGLGAYFGGPAGALVGVKLGSVIGAGIGAWLTSNTSVVEEAATNYGAKVTKNFNTELEKIADPKMRSKAIEGLSMVASKYSDIALASPEARAALALESKMVLSMVEQTKNIAMFSEVMLATGQSSDVIAKNFKNVSTESQKATEYLSEFTTSLSDKTIHLQFVDTYSESFNKLLDLVSTETLQVNLVARVAQDSDMVNIFGSAERELNTAIEKMQIKLKMARKDVQSLGSDEFASLAGQAEVDVGGFLAVGVDLLALLKNLDKGGFDFNSMFKGLNTSIDAAQQDSIRTIEVLRQLQAGVDSGAISYEDYTKAMGDTRSGLFSLNSAIADAETQFASLRTLTKDPLFMESLSADGKAALTELVTGAEIRLALVKAQQAAEVDVYNSMKSQDDVLQKMLDKRQLLTEITPKKRTDIQQYMDLVTQGKPAEQQVLFKIDYATQIVKENQESLKAYLTFKNNVADISNSISTALQRPANDMRQASSSAISAAELTAQKAKELILSATTETGEATAANLNALGQGITATYSKIRTSATGTLTVIANGVESTTTVYSDKVTKAGADALDAMNSIDANIQESYKQVLGFMEKKTSEYLAGIVKLNAEAKSLEDQKLKLTLDIKINSDQAKRDLVNTLNDLKMERLELELQLIQAKGDSGTISKQDSLDQQNTKEQEILNFRKKLIDLEYAQSIRQSTDKIKQIQLDEQINTRKIEAERDLALAAVEKDRTYVNTMTHLFEENGRLQAAMNESNQQALAQTNQKFIAGLAAALTDGARIIGTAIKTQGETLGVVGQKNVIPDFTKFDTKGYFQETKKNFESAADGYETLLRSNAATQIELEHTKARADTSAALQEIDTAKAVHDEKITNLGIERQTQTEQHKARVNDLAKEGADEAKKRAEALKKLQDDYAKAIEGVTKVLLEMLQSIVKQIGEIVTKSLERKVEMAKRKEEIVNSLLTRTTEKLTEATSKQQEVLNEEISLRKEVEDSIKSLAEIQKTYIDSLTGDDRSIKESSKALIAGILDQKKKQIDLSRTISQRLRLDTQVKTLEERKLELEKQLEAATAAREAAEQRLASAQQFVAQLTDLVSGSMFNLSQSLQQFAQAIAQVQAVVNQGLSDGFTSAEMMGGVQGFANNIINSLLTGSMGKGTFSNAISGLLNAGKVLNSAGSKIATAVGSNAPLTSPRPVTRTSSLGATGAVSGGFWATAGAAIGGAMTGFGVGNIVGMLTKDPGFGSSIGGAIGGALATAFPSIITSVMPGVVSGISGGLASAGFTAMAGMVVPIIGALAGALIGRLFSKTPKASATGKFTESGFTTTSTSQRKMPGGTAQALADVSGDTLTQFVDGLKTIGIAFKDVVNTSVSMKKDKITGASLSFAGGQSFSFGGTKADQAGMQKLAQFYLDSFIKGLRQGSLVVDKTIKGASTLQAAIDKFASSSNGTKTIERLQEAITYAENFSKIIDSLGQAVPVSMEGAIAQIQEGAASNASAIASYYTDLKKQAADFLGTSAADYAILTKAIKANALAQLGLAQDTDGSLKSIEAATAELNAGSLAIANIVAGISSFSVALTAAGFSLTEATRIVDYALNNQLSTFIGTIGKNLQDSIDILKNPATQSSIELAAIIDNAQERNKQAEGVLSELNKTASKISASTITKAIQNVAKSAELGALEVQAYLESLDIAQLKAVIADTARIDSTTRLAAETRLAALQEADRAQALKQFIKSSREFNKALFEITQSASSPEFLGVATSALEIADKLGKTSIDAASSDIASYINNVAKGIDIVDNASNTIAALNAEYAASNITATQYVEVLDILQETTLDSVETLKSLVTSISDTTQEIYDMYTSSTDNLLTATEDVGSRFSDLLDTFKEQTMTILGIFDDTLKDVADSGNKLYDLRDTAKDAFQSAADAVTEFEKNNKLSGKTSAQLTTELSAVATKIAALSGTSVDFASFLQLATLTSQQRALQTELSKVNTTQTEYSKLLTARATAEADYAYASKTVTDLEASATAKLIDTRITESETVQQVKEAAYDFITSQKDLKDITQLLTAANFNLNQVRFEERDRVVQVAEALQSVTTTAKSINEETAALNATTLASVQTTARLNAELKYGAAATALITEAVNDATNSFNSLKTVSASIQTAVRDIINIGAVTSTTTTAQISGIYDAIVTSIKNAATAVKINDSLLTDSFDGYSATITGYLTNIKTALGTAFDATDTTKYNAFVANITTTQNALNLITPTLTAIATGAASLATVTTASASISENISAFKDSIVYAVQNLLEAFSTSRKDKIDAFRESLEKLDAIGVTINSTTGLKQALIDVNTKASDTASSVTTLATNFTKLSTALAGLFDTTTGTTTVKGLITQANDAIVGLATRLKTAWDAVVLNTKTAVSGNIVVSTSLSSGDSANLATIAGNTAKYVYLNAVGAAGYTETKFKAEGGYIEGPGSATSDSIPARLSNGEYVIKASSVRKIGKGVLDSINETGNLGYSLSNMGRKGDSIIAHINPEEARLLRSRGGSGTFNPKTGLIEFYNNVDAYGGLFAKEEKAKLMNDFKAALPSSSLSVAAVAPGSFARVDNSGDQYSAWNYGQALRLGGNASAADSIINLVADTMMLSSRPMKARGLGNVSNMSFGIGAVGASSKNAGLNNMYAKLNNGSVYSQDSSKVGYGPDAKSATLTRGGLRARPNQMLKLLGSTVAGQPSIMSADANVAGISQSVIDNYVDAMNAKNKMFFDLYMLSSTSSKAGSVPRFGPGGFKANAGVATVGSTLATDVNSLVGDTYAYQFRQAGNYKAQSPEALAAAKQAGVFVGPNGEFGAVAQARYEENVGVSSYTPQNPFASSTSSAGRFVDFNSVLGDKARLGATQSIAGPYLNSTLFKFASGGLVTSPRDSVSAMLEPGEFVLRKQAVDRMGIDSAIRLNSTGDVGSGDVEVNINNNGTSQTTVGTPEVRRENGKIIIDIILEDLRNNGPIKRQIRSMR